MTKFKQILEKQNKTLYDVGRAMGVMSTPTSIRNIASGKTLVSECDYSTVSFLTRLLNVAPEELMEDFELDGTVENIKLLNNLKNRISKKVGAIDENTLFKNIIVKNRPSVIYIVEDDHGNSEMDFVYINEDGTFETLKAEYSVSEGVRECNFYKIVSDQPLFKETPLFMEPSLKTGTLSEGTPLKNESSLSSETNGDSLMRDPSINSESDLKEAPSGSEPGINLETLLKAVDSESGDEIDYFKFMEEINPVIYKLFKKN